MKGFIIGSVMGITLSLSLRYAGGVTVLGSAIIGAIVGAIAALIVEDGN